MLCVRVRDKCRRKTEILYRQQYSRTMAVLLSYGPPPLVRNRSTSSTDNNRIGLDAGARDRDHTRVRTLHNKYRIYISFCSSRFRPVKTSYVYKLAEAQMFGARKKKRRKKRIV